MEQHPVPQNVTTFQFRLIGDMTLKQFGYLAGGAILGYIFFKLPLPLFLNYPLAIIFALGGFGFAFVPVEERPMDVWVMSFFKSIYSPTQYVWSKTVSQPKIPVPQTPRAAPVQQAAYVKPPVVTPAAPALQMNRPPVPTVQQGVSRRGDILSNLFSPSAPAATAPRGAVLTANAVRSRSSPLDWLFAMLMPKPHPQSVQETPPVRKETRFTSTTPVKMDFSPPPSVLTREQTIAQTVKKEAEVQQKVAGLKKKLEGVPLAQPQVVDLQKQITDLIAERDKMEAEVARLRLQNTPPSPRKSTSTYVATPASQKGPSVRIITPDRAVKAGLPRLTTFPNVVTGIVKDGDQNLLPGVLVTVKDKDGVPLRALKTNRLGQFAASTPIANGTYIVEVEDPRLRYTFDRAQITLNGTVVPALEIFAKSQKEITRAKLEKELFGNKTN